MTQNAIHACPKCGAPLIRNPLANVWWCMACSWNYAASRQIAPPRRVAPPPFEPGAEEWVQQATDELVALGLKAIKSRRAVGESAALEALAEVLVELAATKIDGECEQLVIEANAVQAVYARQDK
jgi:hypothetical protein